MNKTARSPERRQLSRELRQKQTSAEEILWELLRDRRMDGLKFRRQHPISQFIADFYCAERRLAIELDGGVHKKTVEQDRARDEAITLHNVRVIRFKNEEILRQPEGVLKEKIRGLTLNPSPYNMARETRLSPSSPSPHDVALPRMWRV